jgi:hypothetical protein
MKALPSPYCMKQVYCFSPKPFFAPAPGERAPWPPQRHPPADSPRSDALTGARASVEGER